MPPLNQDTAQHSKEVILPFHALLSMLRQNGFLIKPDDYIEMLKVIEKFGSDDITKAGPLICPLIANSPEQQEKFYRVFEQYVSVETEPASGSQPPPPHRKWLWILAGGAVLVLLYVLISNIFLKPEPLSAEFTQLIKPVRPAEDTAVRMGDTLVLDAGAMFRKKPSSAKNVRLLWNLGDGWKEGPVRQSTVLQKEGPLTVGLKISSDKIPVKDSMKTATIHVCPRLPLITLTAPEKNKYKVGDSITITAGYNGQPSPFVRTIWKINEDDTSKSYNQPVLRYRFDSNGTYRFGFYGVYDNALSSCDYIHYFTPVISIEDDKSYTLTVTPSGVPASNKAKLNPLINWLLLIPALSIVLGSLFRWRKKKKNHEAQQKPGPLTFEGARPPYETPFENKDLQLVTKENTFNPVFRSFRQKAEDEVTIFNVRKTIQSTIRAGGLPEFVFSSRLRYNDYLVLIERTVTNDQQARLFDYLVRTLNEEAINVEWFHFQSFDKFVNDAYPEGLSLQRLSEVYKQHTLIVIGNARHLVYKTYPVMEKKILETLNEWDYKGILTPVGYKDWGENENLVKQHLILLPADIKGQLILVQSIREQQRNHEKYLSSIDDFYETQAIDFESAEELKDYLDDEVLFQWLCALCVFHKLRWEIVIEMGKAICSRYGVPERVNYTSLLKLVRIGWMQEGAFPGITRLELLKKLTVENEMIARKTMLHLLEYSDTYFGKNHFFEEEKEIQKTTSGFILYANDPSKYPQYKAEQDRFKALWQNDQIRDTPQKAYLDKHPGDNWTTPIEQDGKSVGVTDYLNRQWITERKQLVKRLLWNGFIAVCLLLVLVCLHLLKDRLPADTLLPLVHVNNNVRYTVIVKDSIECAAPAASTASIGNLTGNLVAGDETYPLNFQPGGDNRLIAYADIPAGPSAAGTGRLEIYWQEGTDEKELESPVTLGNNTFTASIQGCEALPPKEPLYIRYNNAASYKAMEEQLGNALNRFEISATQQEFTDSSRIVYYQPDQKPRADSIAQVIRQKFGMNITAEYIAEQRTPPAVPILYLNIPATGCTFSLHAGLFDVWYGETYTRSGATAINRLITIDPDKKLIWYSTGDKSTYGTYRVDEVCFDNGTYKIITRAGARYQAFLLRNVQPSSFELSVCSKRYDSKEEAKAADESNCGGFNKMLPYYAYDNAKIFLPVKPGKIESSNLSKINRLNDSISRLKKSGAVVKTAGTLYYNPILRRQVPAGLPGPVVQNIPLRSQTPFDRSYVQYKVTVSREPDVRDEPAKDIAPDCSRTFTSLAQTRSVNPLKVCRLNLSNKNLKEVPKEIYSFKNLRQLDLRNNYIPDNDLQRLQKELPDCKLTYEPQKKTEETDNKITRLYTIEFDEKDYPVQSAIGFINRLGVFLKGYPEYKVSLFVYYSEGTTGLKRARARVKIVSDLLQKSGAASGQVLTAFNKLPDPTPRQQQNENNNFTSVSDQLRDKILVNGIGFTEVPDLNKPAY